MNRTPRLLLLLLLSFPSLPLTAHWCVNQHAPYREPSPGTRPSISLRNTLITIPVVFHVVWKSDADNISDAQIASQIDELNRAYRRQNTNQDIITPVFRGIAADMEIEFCLAASTPDGLATSGITRTKTEVEEIASALTPDGRRRICYTQEGGHDAWDTDRYLNIWVGETASGIAGEASFPGQDIASEDGIRIAPDRVGTTGTVLAPYHLGNTLVHEIGHYLNLQHLWGDCPLDQLCCPDFDAECDCDDEVEDTPSSLDPFLMECPEGIRMTCGSADMYMNYMTFANDDCLAMFTTGQKDRVRATLEGPRRGLALSAGCSPGIVSTGKESSRIHLEAYPNPANNIVHLRGQDRSPVYLSIFDATGKKRLEAGNLRLPTQVSVAGLPPGLYWINLSAAGKNWLKKLIIAR